MGKGGRTGLMLLFPMAVAIIPVPSLGRGRGRTGRTGGMQTGAAGGGGEPGSHLYLTARVLPQLSNVGRGGDVSAAVIHGLYLHPGPIHELSLLCCWSGTVSAVTCPHPGICRQGVISFINPKSSFLSCGFSLLLYCPRVLEPSLSFSVSKTGARPCTDPLGAETPSLISVKPRQTERRGSSAARGVHAGSESARTRPGRGALARPPTGASAGTSSRPRLILV